MAGSNERRTRDRMLHRALASVRISNWWSHKVPPLLLVVYIESLRRHAHADATVASAVLLLCCVSCIAAYGHVLNDWCDIRDDARAGKSNTMQSLKEWQRSLFCGLLLVGGFAFTAPFTNAWPPRIAIAFNYLWPTIYSLPHIRLKERGILGVLCDAAGSHVTPTILAFTIVGLFYEGPLSIVVTVAVVGWASVLGLKGILYHQIGDLANDRTAGVHTFASGQDAARLFAWLGRYNIWVELPMSVLLTAAVAIFFPLAILALAIYLVLELTKCTLGFEFAVSSDAIIRRRSVPFANEMFYTLWLPLFACTEVAIANTTLFWLPLAHLLLFADRAQAQIADFRAIASQLRMRFSRAKSG